MDDVAVVVSNSHGLWAAWHRELDGSLALPAEAFHALHLPWGAPMQPAYRHRRVRAKQIMISKPLRHSSSIYGIPIVNGALYAAADGFGVVVRVLTDHDRQLSEDEFAVADSESTVSVTFLPNDSAAIHTTSVADIHPELIEIDGQFSELSNDSSGDADRHALLKIASSNSNVLVTGPKSVGKSYSLQQLSKMSRLSYIFISGMDLKRPFDLKKYAAGGSPPYIAVLDDIDEIDISDVLTCFDSISSNSQILAIIAAVISSQTLPISLRKRFSKIVEIHAPTHVQRQRILQTLFHEDSKSLDLAAYVASLTPGFTPCSLKNLCIRARSSAALLDEPISPSHFHNILGNRIKCLQRFAGYESIVRRLSAIKHQWIQQDLDTNGVLFSGVLLYGPSGCGKTLLINSLLYQDLSLNCLTLSAASIYSKYLGDSEARLRKAFREARQRKPCLLFMDDIDGISGSRESDDGSDSGVKNRVLSTLLNELDGVSGRDGVYIIAATNRIDRVDSALLRPGRFDVHLKIGFPSYSDRLNILKCCIESMKVDTDINLEEIAAVEMTGADIRDICQRAGLMALARNQNASSITAGDFNLAFREWINLHSMGATSNK